MQTIVGRGAARGGELFRDWFQQLGQAAENGGKSAYVFVMGSMCEVLRAFDLLPVFPEINSLQTAVRRVAQDYLSQAEDYGYSPDICGYVKADVAVQLRGGEHPMGKIPRPSLAIATNACNTYIKWVEIWERMHHMPVFTLDIPGSRSATFQEGPGTPGFERDRLYLQRQIEELIALCESITGTRLDLDRLRQVLAWTNEMSRHWKSIIRLNRATPAPFNALTEGTVYLGVLNALRGTPEGAAYFRDLHEEMRYKVDHRLGTSHEEKYRLMFLGIPCYPLFRRFYEMFSEWGGAFVSSTYLWFAAGGLDAGYEYDLDRPLESLAEGVLMSVRGAMDSMFFQTEAILRTVGDYELDGIVYHPIKSCRTVSTGLADIRRDVMERCDVPSLYIESDMMDRRVVSEAQLKNRIDAFFEGLASRRLRQAGKE
ncbi:MAG: 2-hydroxyacyl-CoA dehydratase family protein [Candidatus Eremiobacterota bacterium]